MENSNQLDKSHSLLKPPSREKEVGLVGFICPHSGEQKKFEFCINECVNKCNPLPLLLSLAHQRKYEEGVYHVTEILNPPQIVYLSRHNAYYLKPNDLIWMTLGRGWHHVVESQKNKIKELGLEQDYIIENNGKPFEAEVSTPHGTAILKGTPDLYIKSTRELFDYKTVRYYFVRKILEENKWEESTYHWQLNIYRAYCFPEAERLILECVIKDWSRKIREEYGIEPKMRLYCPVFPIPFVKEFVRAKIDYLLKCEEDRSQLRDCLNDELWINKQGEPLRCLEYCGVRDVCPQFASRKK